MDEIKDNEVRCVRDFFVMAELLKKNFKIVDINKDKKFICPVINEKCTFKSVVYFELTEDLDRTIQEIYESMEKKVEDG